MMCWDLRQEVLRAQQTAGEVGGEVGEVGAEAVDDVVGRVVRAVRTVKGVGEKVVKGVGEVVEGDAVHDFLKYWVNP